MRRSRLFAVVGASVLIGVSIFGGALSAQAEIQAPILEQPELAVTTDSSYLPGGKFQATDYNGADEESDTYHIRVSQYLGTDLNDEIGYCETYTPIYYNDLYDWSCDSTLTLSPGRNTLIAVVSRSSDAYNVVSADSDHVEITLGTQQLTVTSADGTTYHARPTFTGTGPSLGTVGIYNGESEICQTTVELDGAWSCTLDYYNSLGVGHYDLAAWIDQYTDGSHPAEQPGVAIHIDVAVPPLPTMSYVFGAASITPTATTTDGGTVAYKRYNPTDNGEGYTWGTVIDGCPDLGEGGFDFDGAPSHTCTYAALAPGIWNFYAQQLVDDVHSDYADDYVLIPETPGFSAVLNADRSITASGSGTTDYLISVLNAGDGTMCTVTVGADGTWSCTFTPAAGSIDLRAIQHAQGFVAAVSSREADCSGECDPLYITVNSYQGYSAYTAVTSLVVPEAPADTTPTTPTTTKPVVIPPLVFTFSDGGKSSYQPGDETDLSGSGLPPGSTVTGELHSTPVVLGTTIVKPDGTFLLHVKVPMDTEPGAHHFVVTVTPPGGVPATVEQAVTVMPVSAGGTVITTDPGAEDRAAGNTADVARGTARDEPAAPSILTDSITTVQDIFRNPIVIGASAAAGLALLLFVAFPAELLNSTVSENYGRFGRRMPKKVGWWKRFEEWLSRAHLLGALTVTTIAAVIFSFADPGVGFDITTLRVILASGLGLFVVGYLSSIISGAIIRRRWKLSTMIELRPLGLVLTLLGVVLSRILDFSPGILIGLILGLTVVGRATKAQEAKATLVEGGTIFGFSILAWVGYSLMAGDTATTWGGALLHDSLVATTAEGLTALFIGMLPFRFLDGSAIFAWRKLVWVAAYLVAAIAFVAIILPSGSNWGAVSESIWIWAIVLGAFTVLSVGVYLLFRYITRNDDEDDEDELSEHEERVEAAEADQAASR